VGHLRQGASLPPLQRAPLTHAFASQYHEHWAATPTPLPSRGFRLSYDTNIPRQAGLSGSSAIVTAALSCLEAFFGDSFALPKPLRPALVLAAESALGITAGLQDRVVQTYEGAVFMDFSAEGMKACGHGDYTPLDPDLLPPLWCVGASVLKTWIALTCSYSFLSGWCGATTRGTAAQCTARCARDGTPATKPRGS